MREIKKYTLNGYNISLEDNFCKLLDIQLQNNTIRAWAIVDTDWPKSKIYLTFLGTNWKFEGSPGKYLKTIQKDDRVWHIFGDKSNPEVEF